MKHWIAICLFTVFASSVEASDFACEPPQIVRCALNPSIEPSPLLPGNNIVCVCEPPPGCFIHPDTGATVCQTKPPLAISCSVTITYSNADAGAPAPVLPSGCDRARIELAIAAALAKLLGAP